MMILEHLDRAGSIFAGLALAFALFVLLFV